jgi:protein-tyrosine-phosphatase/DNA-binding HxlR family transcriptional regulator
MSQLDPLPFLKLLAHDLRWAIVQQLVSSDCRVNEIVATIGEPMNVVSYHLKQMRDAGLVAARRSDADGRDVYYSLNLPVLSDALQRTAHMLNPSLLAQAAGESAVKPRRVLFLCTHNSGRSQIAEGLLRDLGGERFEVFSAGSHPTIIVPEARLAMEEIGIDIGGQVSSHVNDFLDQPFDYVITLCDNMREVCPPFSGGEVKLHWGYPDPARHQDREARLGAYRDVVRQLRARLQYLVKSA